MADDVSYPSIDPSTFDLIVVGTGLPESIIAAASSAAGKSVLHLDPNTFYGSHYSSLPLEDFISFLHSQQDLPLSMKSYSPSPVNVDDDYVAVDLKPRSLYSDIEISASQRFSEDLKHSRKFSLDLSGPRVLFCADSLVDVLLNSGASHHIEFKSVDASLVYTSSSDGKKKLSIVPDSSSTIFSNGSLDLNEKYKLRRFFKLVQEHFESTMEGNNGGEERRRISDEDLEIPFVEYLRKQQLLPKIKSIILYAISMSDYNQDDPDLCKNLLKTKDGIKSLALFHSSVGRFSNAPGALIYPIYGQGELPQAFCRCAAVKGALYVLRLPVVAVLMHKDSGQYKGVKLASGQNLFSHQLLMGPSVVPSKSDMSSVFDLLQESSKDVNVREVKTKVARGVCITRGSIKPDLSNLTRGSIKPDLSNLLVIFPPKSLNSEQVTSVRALQLGSNLAVCSPGMFVLYFSTLCDDLTQGKAAVHAAMDALLRRPPLSENPESSTSIRTEDAEETKPTLLWSAVYIQEQEKGSSGAISFCPMPDGNLDYRDILESTVKMFQKMYPGDEFFPETKASENIEDDGSSLE